MQDLPQGDASETVPKLVESEELGQHILHEAIACAKSLPNLDELPLGAIPCQDLPQGDGGETVPKLGMRGMARVLDGV